VATTTRAKIAKKHIRALRLERVGGVGLGTKKSKTTECERCHASRGHLVKQSIKLWNFGFRKKKRRTSDDSDNGCDENEAENGGGSHYTTRNSGLNSWRKGLEDLKTSELRKLKESTPKRQVEGVAGFCIS
jgi:hypothetical protein